MSCAGLDTGQWEDAASIGGTAATGGRGTTGPAVWRLGTKQRPPGGRVFEKRPVPAAAFLQNIRLLWPRCLVGVSWWALGVSGCQWGCSPVSSRSRWSMVLPACPLVLWVTGEGCSPNCDCRFVYFSFQLFYCTCSKSLSSEAFRMVMSS